MVGIFVQSSKENDGLKKHLFMFTSNFRTFVKKVFFCDAIWRVLLRCGMVVELDDWQTFKATGTPHK